MLGAREAPADDVGREPVGRHRPEDVALQAQEHGRVAGQGAHDGVDEPCGAVRRRQRGGHVQGDGQEVLEPRSG
jgi:hypothetical protein